MDPRYERLLRSVEKPGRYLGNERGSVQKDPASVRVRFALAFPEVYEIAQSHLGLQILYEVLNRDPDVYCERVYAPWTDMEALLRRNGLPLVSLETGTPLRDFDVVGFSLQYELTYTNVLQMLDLGGVPLLAAERGGDDPVIVAGGPCAFNPQPLAPFLDAVLLGDGEEAVRDIAAVVAAWDGRGRLDLWHALAAIDGLYVPGLYTDVHETDGRLRAVHAAAPAPAAVRKRILADLNTVPLLGRQLVPTMDIVHDRVALEVMRGCVKGCRFCQAGYIYRPLRERDPQALLAHTERLLRESGYDEVSLLSLSTGDYSCVNPLLAALMDRLAPQRIAVSLPSTRVDALDARLLDQIRRVRKTGFTLAPEAGTQRLRDVIQKEYREDELVQAAELIFSLGWRSVKLYFMLGLPSETEEDLFGIVDLARKVSAAGKHRRQVTASVSTFVPKPHTPFQWAPQLPIEEVEARQGLLRRELRRHGIQFKWHDARLSYLEGVFARGDRRLATPLLAAYRAGCRFDGWTEQFHFDRWQRAFVDAGIDPDWYHRRRVLDEPLPWDHLDSGVDKRYLQRELANAFARTLTPDCSIERCTYCGACDFTRVRNVTFHPRAAKGSEGRGPNVAAWADDAMPSGVDWPTRNWRNLIDGGRRARAAAEPEPTLEIARDVPPARAAAAPQASEPGEGQAEEWLGTPRQALEPIGDARPAAPVVRIRITYQKLDRARFLGTHELATAFMRACRRAGMPLAFSGGHHPLPRMSFGPALSLGFGSLCELLDVDLIEAWSPAHVHDALGRELPDGLTVVETEALPIHAPSIDRRLRAMLFTVSWSGLPPGRVAAEEVDARLHAYDAAESFFVEKTSRGAVRCFDARPLATVTRTGATSVLVNVRIGRAGMPKPHLLVAAVLGLTPLEAALLDVTKVACVLDDDDRPDTAATATAAAPASA